MNRLYFLTLFILGIIFVSIANFLIIGKFNVLESVSISFIGTLAFIIIYRALHK